MKHKHKKRKYESKAHKELLKPEPEHNEELVEINTKSFHQNFAILIRHYKEADVVRSKR